ncbi:MAG: hypothetical protein F6K16_41575 [Symploca sp. SIO2B6]|nr:hypothetical protein [Symploca sp. SIO2B6]
MAQQPVGAGSGAKVRSPQLPLQDPPKESLSAPSHQQSSAPTVELPSIESPGTLPLGTTQQYVSPSSTPVSNYSTPEPDSSDRPNESLPDESLPDPSVPDESSSNTEPQFPSRYPQSPNPTIQPHPAMPDPTPEPTVDETQNAEDDQFWQSIFWPGLPLMAAGVLAIVVLRNLDALTGKVPPTIEPTPIEEIENTSDGIPDNGVIPPNDVVPPNDVIPDDDIVPSNNGNAGGDGNQPVEASASALEKAKTSMAAGEYEDALRWLEEVPPNAQTEEYAQLVAEAEQLRNQSGQTNRAMLDEAIVSLNQPRVSTEVNQASDYGRAMVLANRIQRGQPLYEEAQQYIQRWGQNILDLAKSRAISGEYAEAIAAAQLIEIDFPTLYQQAQALIKDWEQYEDTGASHQEMIETVRSTIRGDSASSYNRAIGRLRSIQLGQPKYEEAQQLIDEWSWEILDIANWRATRGNFYPAIDAASLVPEGTAAYQDAKDAIAEWRQELVGG